MTTQAELVITSPMGPLCLKEQHGYLTHCTWTDQALHSQYASPFLWQVAQQLHEYFSGKRLAFDLPLAPAGTPFQKAVWQALTTIPYGQTCSYQQLAQAIGCDKAYRAVGNANGQNPLCIIIPCHRVIRANGGLGGYTGGIRYKEYLLALEHHPSGINSAMA